MLIWFAHVAKTVKKYNMALLGAHFFALKYFPCRLRRLNPCWRFPGANHGGRKLKKPVLLTFEGCRRREHKEMDQRFERTREFWRESSITTGNCLVYSLI